MSGTTPAGSGPDLGYPHRMPFRSVHDRIPYSPIIDRPPFKWPGGASVAAWVVPNIEHYEFLPPAGEVDPYPRTPHPDVRKYGYHDYGNRVGFARMLEVFDRYDIPATVSLNTAVLELYPRIAEAMIARGWEFMCHGMFNTRYLTGLTVDDERALIAECNDLLMKHTGARFAGMLGPNITGNHWTPDVMAEAGMLYQADWVHDELPSPLKTTTGRLVALPYSYELNDAPLLMRSNVESDEYVRRCIAQHDRLEQDAGSLEGARMMAIPLHPFTIGQPHRIRALDYLFEYLRARGTWVATASDLVHFYLEQTDAAV